VLSAHHVLRSKGGTLSPHRVKTAMAVRGSTTLHYGWNEFLPRHFAQTAQRCGLGTVIEHMIEELTESTEQVIDSVQCRLTSEFPEALARDVFGGVRLCVERMKDS
jgi:serine/threonine-protein kinase HipA